MNKIRRVLLDLSLAQLSPFRRQRWISLEEAFTISTLMQLYNIKNYYESGTANGFSCSWAVSSLLNNTPNPVVHTWDVIDRPKIWNSYSELDELKKHIIFHEDMFSKISFHEIIHPALFFIDGGHNTFPFSEDMKAVFCAAKKDDLVLIHDIAHYGHIKNEFEKLSKKFKTRYFDTARGMGLLFI